LALRKSLNVNDLIFQTVEDGFESITDPGLDSRSVLEDIEAVLRKIEHWHQGLDRKVQDHVPGRQRISARRSMERQNRVGSRPGRNR
jgi:hypothetical protein